MDPRIALAREEHAASLASEREAGVHREQRDRIVRLLRAENARFWSYGRLARDIGCSRELIAYIIKSPPPEQSV